jgi:phage terminase large subunit-like protein
LKSFLQWLDEDGFYVKQVWDMEKNEWSDGPGLLKLFPFQRRILGHCLTPDENGKLPYSTIVYSTLKKSGKTIILAAILAWAGECAPDNSELFSCANDMEQAASRAYADVQFHVEKKLGLTTTAKKVRYENGSTTVVLANQYSSAAGSRQFLSTFDELWGYSSEGSRRMWAELTPPATVKNAMRVVATYAGFETESIQLKDLYDLCFKKEGGKYINGEVVPELEDIVDMRGDPVCRRSGRVFIYWDTEPRMPWQTPEFYEQEMLTLRPMDFLRMHRNRWASSNESFIPVEMWDRAASRLQGPLTLFRDDPLRSMPISIGVDIGTKYDTSAMVGTYYNSQTRKVGVAFHRIWTPLQDGQILDLELTVERELLKLWKEFKIVGILYDPTQFQRSAVALKKMGMPLIEVPQQGSIMIEMTQNLYDLMRSNNLEAYPSPELRDHIQYATAEHTSRGYRLKKNENAKYPIDAAQALAMAAYDSVNRGGVDTSIPIFIQSPFSDDNGSTRIPTIWDEINAKLPEALRS